MRTETPLWEKVFQGPWCRVYVHAGKIIDHPGCSAVAFFDAAKSLPDYDRHRYEAAARDLTVGARREQGQYELHAAAKRVLRVVLGPAPDDPEYRRWWESRLVSVRQMREAGQSVEWAEEPPVPPGPAKGPKEKEPAKPRKAPARRAKKSV